MPPPTRTGRARRAVNQAIRAAVRRAPQQWRFALVRRMVELDHTPNPRLQFKIAETQDELEACFSILHDAYVGQGFMKPDPSGLRVTPYHALPTTTTLCAKFDGQVVGTVSIVREGVFGFPMQKIFDISAVRAQGGNIAEISALAIRRDFRRTGGTILFPLIKFVHEYCTQHFDTRHVLIAVNPDRIDLYEALLLFKRLKANPVARYDFVNGAPAVGASLDFATSVDRMASVYEHRPAGQNLHRYFCETRLDNIAIPDARYFTTNHAVLTPALMDHFFNVRTRVFSSLDERQRCLLRSIYDLDDYAPVLPGVAPEAARRIELRKHPRHSVRCPAQLQLDDAQSQAPVALNVVRLGSTGFVAETDALLPQGRPAHITVDLGASVRSVVTARVAQRVQDPARRQYNFDIQQADGAWAQCVAALQRCQTHRELAFGR